MVKKQMILSLNPEWYERMSRIAKEKALDENRTVSVQMLIREAISEKYDLRAGEKA